MIGLIFMKTIECSYVTLTQTFHTANHVPAICCGCMGMKLLLNGGMLRVCVTRAQGSLGRHPVRLVCSETQTISTVRGRSQLSTFMKAYTAYAV